MQVELGDYIIFGRQMGFVCAILDGKVKVDVEDDQVIVDLVDVDANIGATPKVGSVYGKKVEPLLHSVQSNYWGSIEFYTKLPKLERTALKRALTIIEERIVQLGMDKIVFPLDRLRIKQNRGKYAGYYRIVKGETIIDFHPKTYGSAKEVAELGYHELGHAYWVNGLNDSQRAEWALLYSKYVDRKVVDLETITSMVDRLLDAETMEEAVAGCSEEELEAFDIVVGEICSSNNLSQEDFHLIHANSRESMREMIPDFSAKQLASAKDFPISDYAGKNTHEFFAESFRAYCSNLKLPKPIAHLMKECV